MPNIAGPTGRPSPRPTSPPRSARPTPSGPPDRTPLVMIAVAFSFIGLLCLCGLARVASLVLSDGASGWSPVAAMRGPVCDRAALDVAVAARNPTQVQAALDVCRQDTDVTPAELAEMNGRLGNLNLALQHGASAHQLLASAQCQKAKEMLVAPPDAMTAELRQELDACWSQWKAAREAEAKVSQDRLAGVFEGFEVNFVKVEDGPESLRYDIIVNGRAERWGAFTVEEGQALVLAMAVTVGAETQQTKYSSRNLCFAVNGDTVTCLATKDIRNSLDPKLKKDLGRLLKSQ